MARKKKDSEDKSAGWTPSPTQQYRIFLDGGVEGWLPLMSEIAPHGGWRRQGGHIVGRCPYHAGDDSDPSAYLTPHKGLYKCFGASCNKTVRNPLRLVAECGKMSWGDAALLIRKRLGLKAHIPEAVQEHLAALEMHQLNKGRWTDFSCKLMADGMVAATTGLPLPPEVVNWAEPAIRWLTQRQFPAEWDTYRGSQLLGFFPPLAILENFYGNDKAGFTWAREYFAKYYDGPGWVGSIVFPLHDEPDSVARIKLRRVVGEERLVVFVEDAFDEARGKHYGYYGLRHYRAFLGGNSPNGEHVGAKDAIVVEGEPDALSSIGHQTQNENDDFLVLSLGGGAAQSVASLKNYGIERIRVVGDNDKGGIGFSKGVLDKTDVEGLGFRVFNWPSTFKDWKDPLDPNKFLKDADDVVRFVGYDSWRTEIVRDDNWRLPQDWIFDRACTEIRSSNIKLDDVRQLLTVSAEWGHALHDPAECDAYCSAMAQQFHLDKNLLYRDIRAQDEDEEMYIERVADKMPEYFSFVGYTTTESRKKAVTVYHLASKRLDTMVLNDEIAAETLIATHYGSITRFFEEHIGAPAFLAETTEGPVSVTVRRKKYREYLNMAFLGISRGLQNIELTPILAQGFHVPANAVAGDLTTYLVNGPDVYALRHAGEGLQVSALNEPTHAGHIFDNSGPTWMPEASSAREIESTECDLEWCFQTVYKILDEAWAFRNHDVDVPFLAAMVLALNVMPVFHRQTALFVTAEPSSGKSRLVSGLLGGTSYGRIHIVPACRALNQYTVAGFRQTCANSTRPTVLEEFEDNGTNDAKSLVVRRINDLGRDLIGEGSATVSMGTTSGRVRQTHLRFALICAAIHPLRDEATASRFITIEMARELTRTDPQNVILNKFGAETISNLRRQMGMGLFRHIPALLRVQAATEARFATGEGLPSYTPARFREALIPALTMLEYLRERGVTYPHRAPIDVLAFASAFCESRNEHFSKIKASSLNEQVIESLLGSPFRFVPNDKKDENVSQVTTLRNMIAEVDNLDLINKTKMGVYYDAHTGWIVVPWVEALQGVLSNSRFRSETPGYMKTISERSVFQINQNRAKALNVLERMRFWMGPGHTYQMISVFDVNHLVKEAQSARDTMRGTRKDVSPQPATPQPGMPDVVEMGQGSVSTPDGDMVV